MRVVRLALKVFGVLLLVVTVGLGGGIAALQTRAGKDWLTARLNGALSGPDSRVEIGRLHGVFPFQTEVAELRLYDRDGAWLTARDIELDIAARDLLRAKLTIRRLVVTDIRVLRQPAPSEQPAKPAASAPPTLPQVPRLPLEIELRRLDLPLVALAQPVLGEEVIVTASGAAAVVSGGAHADLALRRIDQQPGAAELRLALADGRLGLQAKVSEPSGLLLAALLGRDDKPALSVELGGDGPLDAWRGKIAAAAGDLARLDADVALSVAEKTQFQAEGTLAAAALLPPDLAPLAGDKVTFAIGATAEQTGRTALDRIEVKAAAATLTGAGTIDGTKLDARLRLEAPDLARVAGAFGVEAAGAGTLSLIATGSTDRPTIEAEIEANGVGYQTYTADAVTARLRAVPDRDVVDPAVRVALDGAGALRAVRVAGDDAPAGLGEEIQWMLAGSTDKALDDAKLDELSLTSGGGTFTASGTAGHLGNEVDATIRLALGDLTRFAGLAGQKDLAGAARLEAKIRREGADRPLAVALTGTADDLITGIAAADALVGKHLKLAGNLRRDPDGALAADDVALEAQNIRVAGKAALPAALDRIATDLRVELPRLAPVGAALGTPLAGRATLTAKLEGPLQAPAGEARLEASDLASGAARLDKLDATLTLADAKEPAGKLDARFRAAQLDGTLAGEFALKDEGRTLAVPKARLAAAGAAIEAALQVALDTKLATGTLNGRIPDLKPWSTLAGMPLAGRADIKATLGAKAGQTVDLAMTGGGFSATTAPGEPPTTLDRLTVNARLADLLGKPTGRADATLGKLAFAGGDLAAAKVTAEAAKPGRFVVTADTKGTIHEPMTLGLTGEIAMEANALDLRLTRLAGDFAGQAFQLRQPLQVSRRGQDLAFQNLALTVAGGQISGAGSLKGETVALKLAAKDLPLDFAGRLAGQDEISGKLGLDVDLSGTLADPRGRVVVQGRGVHLAARTRPDLPPLGLTTEANWRGERVEFRGRVDAPNNQGIGFSGAAPLRLKRDPVGVELPPDGAIALKLEGDGRLQDVADLLPLGEDRVAGVFHLNATVGGTIAAPSASGSFTLSDGRYESMAAGAVVSDIAIEIAGDRDRFVLRRFTARDGAKGQFAAQGAVVLSVTPGPAFDIAASMKSFRVVKRDEGTGVASGDIRIGGTLGEPDVKARIRIENAEIRVPDKLPPSVAQLDVVEIDSRTGARVAPQAPGKPKDPALPAKLDIVVDVPNQLFVRGRGLDSEWKGRITVGGTSAEPDVVGQLEVVRGTLSLLGRNFTLTNATVGFDGGAQIDPVLDITAETKSSDITAQVIVGGRGSAPTLKLTSTPELPQDEVLARVLFNRSVGQLSPAQGIQLAAAVSTLASGGPGILDRMRGRLGLDRLDIGSGDQSSGKSGSGQNAGAGGTTVSAGKYVSEGVYVGVDQSVSGQSKARVEVELFPNVTIETEAGGQSGQGIGLNWKKDY